MAQLMGGQQYTTCVAIVTSDVTPQGDFLGFMVGVGGTVQFKPLVGVSVQVTAVAGFLYPVEFSQVFTTGTSATGIVGLA